MLTEEIAKYYANKGFKIDDMIKAAAKKKVSKGHLKLALEHCYKKMKENKHIADADIFRYVLNVARGFESEQKSTPDETVLRNAQAEAYTMREKAVKLSVAAKNIKSQLYAVSNELDDLVKLHAIEQARNKRLIFKLWLLAAGFVSLAIMTLYLNYNYWRLF